MGQIGKRGGGQPQPIPVVLVRQRSYWFRKFLMFCFVVFMVIALATKCNAGSDKGLLQNAADQYAEGGSHSGQVEHGIDFAVKWAKTHPANGAKFVCIEVHKGDDEMFGVFRMRTTHGHNSAGRQRYGDGKCPTVDAFFAN